MKWRRVGWLIQTPRVRFLPVAFGGSRKKAVAALHLNTANNCPRAKVPILNEFIHKVTVTAWDSEHANLEQGISRVRKQTTCLFRRPSSVKMLTWRECPGEWEFRPGYAFAADGVRSRSKNTWSRNGIPSAISASGYPFDGVNASRTILDMRKPCRW